MRVIGGSYRSRPLAAPAGAETRPTSDRLRETLFNILAQRIAGARLLDLYCGTGAVGIEALSRGATDVTFVERAPAALRVLRANLASLGIVTGAAIEGKPVAAVLHILLDRSRTLPRPFDIVFMDPPYESAGEYTGTLTLLGGEHADRVLAAGALVIAEHATRVPLPARFGRLVRTRTLKQGDATLSLFSSASGSDRAAAPPEECSGSERG